MLKGKRIVRFVGVGIVATLIDYCVYELMVLVVFGSADWVWLAAMIAGLVATGAAYLMHRNITWKERDPGKYGVLKFFIWNIKILVGFRPVLTLILGLLDGLYVWASQLCHDIGLNLSNDFVKSTGIYVLATAVTMVLNFIAYEKLIFKKTDEERQSEKALGKE